MQAGSLLWLEEEFGGAPAIRAFPGGLRSSGLSPLERVLAIGHAILIPSWLNDVRLVERLSIGRDIERKLRRSRGGVAA